MKEIKKITRASHCAASLFILMAASVFFLSGCSKGDDPTKAENYRDDYPALGKPYKFRVEFTADQPDIYVFRFEDWSFRYTYYIDNIVALDKETMTLLTFRSGGIVEDGTIEEINHLDWRPFSVERPSPLILEAEVPHNFLSFGSTSLVKDTGDAPNEQSVKDPITVKLFINNKLIITRTGKLGAGVSITWSIARQKYLYDDGYKEVECLNFD